jgi:2-polyprenyl-6-methoxyphenol hydroxylase-like FAD-dependent oxidoreductase
MQRRGSEVNVIIVGGGIAGLTTALFLERIGIRARVFEAATEYRPIGVGINMLPHAMRDLDALGLTPALAALGIEAREFAFYNRHGQHIYSEPCGRHAGYEFPHFSIHRADLHQVLHQAVIERLGAGAVQMGRRAMRVEQDAGSASVFFEDARSGAALPPERADAVIACDGYHSAIRRQFYPDEKPAFGGINMWRGVTRGRPFLTGASVTRIGPISPGKFLIYPIRDLGDGTQLINWVAEVQGGSWQMNDWHTPGRREDFAHLYRDWRFDWVDVPDLIDRAEFILQYPMVDRDPVERWAFGRVTLLGDAAHPMYPRGGNGAAQSIIDARTIAGILQRGDDVETAFAAFEAERLAPTATIVRTNRVRPPDALINLVEERTGGGRFERIEDVVSPDEIRALVQGYASVAGYDIASANRQPITTGV